MVTGAHVVFPSQRFDPLKIAPTYMLEKGLRGSKTKLMVSQWHTETQKLLSQEAKGSCFHLCCILVMRLCPTEDHKLNYLSNL